MSPNRLARPCYIALYVQRQAKRRRTATSTARTFINAFAQDFEQHGIAVIEQVRKERPQDYFERCRAALLPKQMEIETKRTRPLSELSDVELMELILEGTEAVVDAILVSRGQVALTAAEHEKLQQR